MDKYILDRFEENFAVLVNRKGEIVNVERSLLQTAKEGDVVLFENGVYRIDDEKTQERRISIQEKMKRLFNKG